MMSTLWTVDLAVTDIPTLGQINLDLENKFYMVYLILLSFLELVF